MMTDKTLAEMLGSAEATVQALRLDVEGLRIHMGSAVHFLTVAVEDLQTLIEQLKASIK